MKLKKHILSALAVALSLILVFAFVACGDKDPEVSGISLNQTAVELETGNTAKLTASATYTDETTADLNAGDVTWTSDKPDVATVTRGIISAKGKGTAKITATYGDYSANCNVTVNAIEVVISGCELNADKKVELEVDDTLTLTAKVLKNDAELANEEIVWSTSAAGKVSVTDGLIKGLNPGEATITATRKNGGQSGSINVIVNEIPGSAKLETYEQNKTPANTWGYWGDQGWNWSNTTIHDAKTVPYREGTPEAGYEYIEAGKMDITFSVNSYGGSMAPGEKDAAIQLFYRSSKENGGKLEANHNYEVKLTILSDTAGKVIINAYDDNATGFSVNEDNEAAHEFELVAGVAQEITVQFRHGDSGAIYANGVYDNVESALNILLGLLSKPIEGQETGNIVKVSVYNIMFKDLGESEHKWKDDPTKIDGYVDPDAPNVPETPELILPVSDVTLTGVTLTAEDGRAYLNLAGTVNMEKFDSVDAAKTWVNDSYFDLQQCGGSWTPVQFNRTTTLNADGTFVVKYDITRLNPDTAGTGAYTAHFSEKEPGEGGYENNKYRDVKLDADAAVAGDSITVGEKKYTIVNHKDYPADDSNNWGQPYNWGCVAIKVENVTAE